LLIAIFIHIVLLKFNVNLFYFKHLFNLASTSQMKFFKWSFSRSHIIMCVPSAESTELDFKLTAGE